MDDKKNADHRHGRHNSAGGGNSPKVNGIIHVDANLSYASNAIPPSILTEFEDNDNYEPTREELDWLASELSPPPQAIIPNTPSKITHLKLTSDDLDHGQYLPDKLLVAMHDKMDSAVIILDVVQGAGKTRQIRDLINHTESGTYFAPLQRLAESQAWLVGITPHTDIDMDVYLDKKWLAMCPQSLLSNSSMLFAETRPITVFDEIEQTFDDLIQHGGTFKKKPQAFESIKQQVQDSDFVVLANKGITPQTLALIEDWTDKPIIHITMNSKPLAGRSIDIVSPAEYQKRVYTALKMNQKTLMACGLNEANRWYNDITERYPDMKVAIVTSENDNLAKYKAEHGEQWFIYFDVCIYSAAMGTGESIDSHHFEAHFLKGTGVNPPEQLFQMINRDRTWSKFTACVGDAGQYSKAILDEGPMELIKRAAKADICRLIGADPTLADKHEDLLNIDKRIAEHKEYYEFWAKRTLNLHKTMADLKADFADIAKGEGVKVTVMDAKEPTDLDKIAMSKRNRLAKKAKEQRAEQALAAFAEKPMGDTEYEQVARSKKRGGDKADTLRFEVKSFQRFYNRLPNDAKELANDDDYQRTKFKRGAAICMSLESAQSEAMRFWLNKSSDLTSGKWHMAKRHLGQTFLEALGIEINNNGTLLADNVQWDRVTLANNEALQHIIDTQKDDWNACMPTNIGKTTAINPTQWVNDTLKAVGVEIKLKRTAKKRQYSAVVDSLNQFVAPQQQDYNTLEWLNCDTLAYNIINKYGIGCHCGGVDIVEDEGHEYAVCEVCEIFEVVKAVNTGGGKVETETEPIPEPIQANF